jgi:hypothetical protein
MLFGSHNIGVDNYYYLSLCTNNADGECPAANNTLTWTQKTTGTSGGWNAPDGSIQLNRWQHVAVTYDCSSIANEPIFYVNGVAVTPNLVVSTPTGATQCNDSSFNKYISAEGLFPGIMDDVRLYSRILTATEIKQLSRLGGATIMP